jgi:protein SCO1/2
MMIAGGALATVMLGIVYTNSSASRSGTDIGGPFQLVDGTGAAVSERSWPGKYLLIYFGYTYCPDVCPTSLNNLTGALAALGKLADKVQPIFITVDPRRDTPKALDAFTHAFTPRLVGLTGTPEQIARVAKEYGVYFERVPTGPDPGDYTVDHSSLIYMMAPDGRFLAPITAALAPDEMAAEIRSHLA